MPVQVDSISIPSLVQMVPVIVQMAPAISCAEDRDGRRVAPQEHREMHRSLAARSGLKRP
ncbi:MAG: hypothetical protein IJ940_06330 [Bacteroidales bacterium]|nr:hypothetical protein [Bacteroidales bacterium]